MQTTLFIILAFLLQQLNINVTLVSITMTLLLHSPLVLTFSVLGKVTADAQDKCRHFDPILYYQKVGFVRLEAIEIRELK